VPDPESLVAPPLLPLPPLLEPLLLPPLPLDVPVVPEPPPPDVVLVVLDASVPASSLPSGWCSEGVDAQAAARTAPAVRKESPRERPGVMDVL
jgi:hypothetical protein